MTSFYQDRSFELSRADNQNRQIKKWLDARTVITNLWQNSQTNRHELEQDRRISKLEKRVNADDKIVAKLERRIAALENQALKLKGKSKK